MVPPRTPSIVACPRCQECYWLAEAEEIGTVERWCAEETQAIPAWSAASKVAEPTEEEYYLAIEKNLAKDREQQRTMRVLAWWRHNDAFRHSSAGASVGSDGWRENLEELARLLNGADETDRLLRAEVHRELGEFVLAKEHLSRVTSPEHRDTVRQLRDLCNRRDTRVRRLSFAEAHDLAALIEMVRTRGGKSRLPGIFALSDFGHDAATAIPVLVEALRDSDVETAFRAMDALCQIGGWADSAFPVLMDLLEDKRYMIRGMAAKYLSKSGPSAKPAIPALRKALSDASCYVRHYAECALRSLEAL
jgi:HEAT repeat protein